MTRGTGRAYSSAMAETKEKPVVDQELKKLERRLEELVVALSQLKEENRSLRVRQDSLAAERSALMQKNEQVRTRVEAMIGRLKSMEHGA